MNINFSTDEENNIKEFYRKLMIRCDYDINNPPQKISNKGYLNLYKEAINICQYLETDLNSIIHFKRPKYLLLLGMISASLFLFNNNIYLLFYKNKFAFFIECLFNIMLSLCLHHLIISNFFIEIEKKIFLNKLNNTYKAYQLTQQKQQEEKEKRLENISEVEQLNEVLNDFKAVKYQGKCTKSINNKLNKIYTLLEQIIEEIKKNPAHIRKVQNIFSLYIKDIINLLKNEDLDNINEFSDMLSKFIDYLDSNLNNIKEEKNDSTMVYIKTLSNIFSENTIEKEKFEIEEDDF